MGENGLPLSDTDPERTLPFRAVVAVPGQDETVDADTAPHLRNPALVETTEEGQRGTVKFGTVLPITSGEPGEAALAAGAALTAGAATGITPPDSAGPGSAASAPPGLPGPSDSREVARDAKTAPAAPPPPTVGWRGTTVGVPTDPTAAAPAPAPLAFEPYAVLSGGFVLEAVCGADPLGEWWNAVHPQFGPCQVLAFGRTQASTEGPRILISVQVAMGVPPDPRLELPVGSGGLPRAWLAVQRRQSSSLGEVLQRGAGLRPLRWARDLAGGLAALHSYGVAHGEVTATHARVPTQGAARWARVALRAEAGPPEILAPELVPGSAPTRGGDVFAFGRLLEDLAQAEESPALRKGLAAIARRCLSDSRPSAPEVLAQVIALEERPAERLSQRPWIWGLVGVFVGAALGALGTWLALAQPG